ncbi:MAG TPA: ABC-F family ATP-binding cassette domain-containing protein [Longimicrobiales bacterium]|nr:ABC-F family ATP-binding cassette domain-containing protein [Longimicrobiales bacterium]
MPLLTVQDLRKSYGTRTVFDGVSFAVEEGERVGFIGANGSGKSTLFRVVADVEGSEGGTIALRRGATVGYLAQEPDFAEGASIRGAVAAGRPELGAALVAWHELARRLAESGADHDRLLARQAELSADIERLGGWDWEHRVEAMLTRLGVADWDRPVAGLSGGEKKRVALARVLLATPDLLLLDEPTNHLDADTVLFLEEYLESYPGAVLLITHDRYFLDRVVDRMIEVSAGALTSYDGAYQEYLQAKEEEAERLGVEDEKRKKLISKELDWVRRSPPARTGKPRARIQRLEALREQQRQRRLQRTRDLSVVAPQAPRLGRTVLDLHHVSKAYGGRTLIRDFSAILRAGERVGIIGPNGAGKTTLLKVILGQEAADAGDVVLGTNTRIAYFDQTRSDLDPAKSVYEAVADTDWVTVGGRRVHLRSYLEDFLFPTAVQQQKVASLSGGERNRLLLAKLLLQESNLLILDEPTNDLDLVTLRVLESVLADYPGAVLVVTHDRFFLDKVATALFVFEGDGVVHRHEGGFELYRRFRAEREAAAAAEAAEREARERERERARRPAPPAAAPPRDGKRLTWKEARELEGLEERILAAETERDALAERLGDPTLYAGDGAEVARLTADYDAAIARVDELYTRWAELEEKANG